MSLCSFTSASRHVRIKTTTSKTHTYISKYPQTHYQIQYTSKPILAARSTEKDRVVINLRVSTCEERVRFVSILFCCSGSSREGSIFMCSFLFFLDGVVCFGSVDDVSLLRLDQESRTDKI
jgi:hypothetical protein